MYAAVDVGATKTLVGVFDDNDKLVKKERFLTSQSYEEFLSDLKKTIDALEEQNFTAAGVAIPGAIDRTKGIATYFGNLRWGEVNITEDLKNIFACPVAVENDAKAGGLSEAGYLKNEFNTVLYIVLGTGIGISLIKNGVVDTEYADRGGQELFVAQNGERTMWEDIASGSAIKERFGKRASDITDDATWEQIASGIALGLAKIIPEKKPDVVVIGGGAGKHFERYGAKVENDLKAALGDDIPALRPAQRPDEAVLYGALELAKKIHG